MQALRGYPFSDAPIDDPIPVNILIAPADSMGFEKRAHAGPHSTADLGGRGTGEHLLSPCPGT